MAEVNLQLYGVLLQGGRAGGAPHGQILRGVKFMGGGAVSWGTWGVREVRVGVVGVWVEVVGVGGGSGYCITAGLDSASGWEQRTSSAPSVRPLQNGLEGAGGDAAAPP